MISNKYPLVLELCLLAFIFFLASYLRFYQVGSAPGWYNDEGTIVIIAKNLLQGKVEYLGITQSTLLAARLPLFPWLLAQLFRFFPEDIETLRGFTASLGILSTILLYFSLRASNKPLALASSLIYAIYPMTVTYTRIGFSYNLCALLVVVLFWELRIYLQSGNRIALSIGAIALGLGLVSELIMFILVPALMICILWKRWQDIWPTIALLLLPFFIYGLTMLITTPQAFCFDLRFTFFRVNSENILVQIAMVLINSSALMMRDGSIVLALLGILITKDKRLKKLLTILLMLPLALVFRSFKVSFLAHQYLIPWLPLVAIGIGLFIIWAIYGITSYTEGMINAVQKRYKLINDHNKVTIQMIAVPSLIFIFILFPIGMNIFMSYGGLWKGEYKTSISGVTIYPQDGLNVIDFIEANYQEGDLILASPALAWALPGTVTDYQISLAYMGLPTEHFPTNIPRSRFLFPMNYHNARFIIVDKIWENWALNSIASLYLVENEITDWAQVYASEDVRVYERPGGDK